MDQNSNEQNCNERPSHIMSWEEDYQGTVAYLQQYFSESQRIEIYAGKFEERINIYEK
jgi:hypothetical protein